MQRCRSTRAARRHRHHHLSPEYREKLPEVRLPNDTLERISYVMGIHKGVAHPVQQHA